MNLIKGFVDMLILASGYQSSGLLAHWDANNIMRAFHWALFFEDVFTRLCSSDIYRESVEELDAALLEMTSDPSFPQGLAHLSSATLKGAKSFLSEHLIQTLPLRDSHFRAFLTAAVQMDLSDLSGTEQDYLGAYLDKLTLQNGNRRSDIMACTMSTQDVASKKLIEKCSAFTPIALQKLSKRMHAVSCISVAESVLDKVSTSCSTLTKCDHILAEQLKHDSFIGTEEVSVDIFAWSNWKSRALSYLLDKKTIRLVSGASLLFSGPEKQWVQVFGRLNISDRNSDDNLLEAVELLLLGRVTSRWQTLVEFLVSVSYDSVPISKQYHLLCTLGLGGSLNFYHGEDNMDAKGCGILDYMTDIMGGQLHLLWKISPILVAASVPPWSPLFKSYLSEIESHVKGDHSIERRCSCSKDKGHNECELAERIWCLYIFHVSGSQMMRNGSGV